jgi:hypothetical protein
MTLPIASLFLSAFQEPSRKAELQAWTREDWDLLASQLDAFGYSDQEWIEALRELTARCPNETFARLCGYVACSAEAGERSGRLLPLRDEVLRHFEAFGVAT